MGGDLDEGGGCGEGIQHMNLDCGLHSEPWETVIKYRSDHITEKALSEPQTVHKPKCEPHGLSDHLF